MRTAPPDSRPPAENATPTPPAAGRAHQGRPRNTALDTAILDAALHEIATCGVDGFSLAAVAKAAGTTRPAIYRRWPNKMALAIDAVGHLAAVKPPQYPGAPFPDLVAELEHFRHCICEAGALPLAGHMLTEGVDPELFTQYQRELVVPRRTRLRAIIQRAIDAGELPADCDVTVAGSFLTGSWYSFAISGTPPPDDWAHRVATLVWVACGGERPGPPKPARRAKPRRSTSLSSKRSTK